MIESTALARVIKLDESIEESIGYSIWSIDKEIEFIVSFLWCMEHD